MNDIKTIRASSVAINEHLMKAFNEALVLIWQAELTPRVKI